MERLERMNILGGQNNESVKHFSHFIIIIIDKSIKFELISLDIIPP